jgi:hypothetical protein
MKTGLDFMPIKELKTLGEWDNRYISAIGLVPVLQKQGNDLKGLEIGICRGENIVKFLEECPNISHIDAVDPYVEYTDDTCTVTKEVADQLCGIAKENFLEFPERVTMHIKTSREFSETVPDEYYDYIFIDGDHKYASVLDDIKLWYPKLKRGGVFSGHDFWLSGVQKAVYEYRTENGIISPVYQCNHTVWWWTK